MPGWRGTPAILVILMWIKWMHMMFQTFCNWDEVWCMLMKASAFLGMLSREKAIYIYMKDFTSATACLRCNLRSLHSKDDSIRLATIDHPAPLVALQSLSLSCLQYQCASACRAFCQDRL